MNANKTKKSISKSDTSVKIIEKTGRKTAQKITKDKKTIQKELTISEQVQDYLAQGGQIQTIPSGVSGQPSVGYRKSMTISEKALGSDNDQGSNK